MTEGAAAVHGLKMSLAALGGVLAGLKIAQAGLEIADLGGHFQSIESRMRMAGWNNKGDTDRAASQANLPPSLRMNGQIGMKGDHHIIGDIEHARKEAFRLSGIYKTLTPADVMETIKESAFVFGDRSHSIEYAEKLSQFKVAMQGALGDVSAKEVNSQVMAGIRALELKGAANDPKQFGSLLEGMAQSIMASGGTVKPHDYMMAMKYSRTAGFRMSDNFFKFVLPTLAQELGGSTIGQSLMTLGQLSLGRNFNSAQIGALKEYGLLEEGTKFTKAGMKTIVETGGIKDRRLMMSDPWEWVQNVLIPGLKGKGLEWETDDGKAKLAEVIGKLYGDRTAQDVIMKLVTQADKIRKDAAMAAEAMGMHAGALEAMNKNYDAVKKSVGTQWERALQIVGYGAVERVLPWLIKMRDVFMSIGDAAAKSPDLTNRLINMTIGVGVSIAAFSAVVVGYLIAAIVGWPILLGATIIIMGAGVVSYFWKEISSWPGRLTGAISAFGASLMSAIKSIFSLNFWKGLGSMGGQGVQGPAATPNTDAMGNVIPQSHVAPPPPQTTVTNIKNTVQVDGRTIADIVASYIAKPGETIKNPGQLAMRRHKTLTVEKDVVVVERQASGSV
jgi:hypothetical protein